MIGFRDWLAYLIVKFASKPYVPAPLWWLALRTALRISPYFRELWITIFAIALKLTFKAYFGPFLDFVKKTGIIPVVII